MDRKNTLLLTVIAIATLLVAVVGATFAFFTAQNNGKAETPVNVKTETTDSLLFGSFDPLFLIANQQNFAEVSDGNKEEHVGSQKAVSTGTIEFKRGANSNQKYCYTAKLVVSQNNFVYAPEGTIYGEDQDGRNIDSGFKRKKAPELLLKVTKTSKNSSDGDSETKVEYNQPLGENGATGCSASDPEAISSCVYYEHLTGQRRVCVQDNQDKESIGEGGITYTEEGCQDAVMLEGLDVTMLKANSGYLTENGTISFPTTESGSNLKHELTASNEKDTVTDTWTAELVFVNYNWDQQYNASTAENAKKFVATWQFAETPCEGE